MAETPTTDADTRPLHPHTPPPPSPFTASPITPTGGRLRLGPRRQSRFTEEVMSEWTPAASISEQSINQLYGPSVDNVSTIHKTNGNNNAGDTDNDNCNSTIFCPLPPKPDSSDTGRTLSGRNRRAWLRLSNSVLHVLPCFVLLALLGYAMPALRRDLRNHMGIQAVILIFFLGVDVILDIFVSVRARNPWPVWGLVTRSVCGTAYIALFFVYVGLGGMFPSGHSYWRLSAGSAGVLASVLLCATGVWNLLHVPVCRYHVGSALRARIAPKESAADAITDNDNRTSFNQNASVAGTERSSTSLIWRRWVRTWSTRYSGEELGYNLQANDTREHSATTLHEQPDEEDGEESAHGRRGATGEWRKQEENGMEGKGEREGANPPPERPAVVGP